MIILKDFKSLNHRMIITIQATFTSVWRTDSKRHFCRFGVERVKSIPEGDSFKIVKIFNNF